MSFQQEMLRINPLTPGYTEDGLMLGLGDVEKHTQSL
ncbi:MAG: hypothetical protein ACI90V_001889, partial [Bacillariaceae sp.]